MKVPTSWGGSKIKVEGGVLVLDVEDDFVIFVVFYRENKTCIYYYISDVFFLIGVSFWKYFLYSVFHWEPSFLTTLLLAI